MSSHPLRLCQRGSPGPDSQNTVLPEHAVQDPTPQRAPETHEGDFAKLRRVTHPEMLLTSDPGDARPLWLVTEADLPRWLSEQPTETASLCLHSGPDHLPRSDVV